MGLAINKESSPDSLTIALDGRLDTTTAPQLEAELKASLDSVKNLIFEMKGLNYISSAGLRVFLEAQNIMNKQGTMTLRNVGPEVMMVFKVTEFDDILNIEK